MLKPIHAAAASLLLCLCLSSGARSANDVDSLARDVARLGALREVKDLQRSYAQYAQAGRWQQMADLFTADARFVYGKETLEGRKAIAAWLTQRAGARGLAPGAVHMEMIDQPLAHLAADGRTARVRWMGLTFAGDGKGGTRIEGGLYENEYVLLGNDWKISRSHYHAQYAGTYAAAGRTSMAATCLSSPITSRSMNRACPSPHPRTRPRSKAALASLVETIDRLNDEDAVRNLEHAYGYYVDRRMWDDVVDLFTDNAVVNITGASRFSGRAGVRQAMERKGPAGLAQGHLNDHLQFDTLVHVLPGGHEAIARSIELGVIGDAGEGTQHWEVNVLRNAS